MVGDDVPRESFLHWPRARFEIEDLPSILGQVVMKEGK